MTEKYQSPLGTLIISASENGLTEISFEKEACNISHSFDNVCEVIEAAKCWLDKYFKGEVPDFTIPLHFDGSPFQLKVWEILRSIPYGQTMTYGQIAKQIEMQCSVPRMSAQAVGGAVGHNPIAIIVPCHRVIGTHGKLTGYAAGMERKIKLLEIEGVDLSCYS